MSQKEKEKIAEYTVKILGALSELFNEDSEYVIDMEDLNTGMNFTHFMHALSTVVPCKVYEDVTKETVDHLGFNHIANRLCMQYGSFKDNDEDN